MKKILCFLFLPFLGFTQQDFGQNATWHYTFSEYGYSGYKKVEHVSDTNLFNMTWLQFQVTGISEIRTGPGPNDLLQDTARSWPDIFLATRNDSVFRLTAKGPFLLYDLSADIGDSWQFAPIDTFGGCPDTPIATVTGKGSETLAGATLAYIDVAMPMDTFLINGQANYQISSSSFLNQRIYPLLGSLSYAGLFSESPNLCNGSSFKVASLSSHSLRCFSNGQVSINRTQSSCDYWSLLSKEELAFANLEVFPNPSAGFIRISAELAISSLELRGLSGKLIKRYAKGKKELLLPAEAGIYLLKVEFETGASQIIKVQKLGS